MFFVVPCDKRGVSGSMGGMLFIEGEVEINMGDDRKPFICIGILSQWNLSPPPPAAFRRGRGGFASPIFHLQMKQFHSFFLRV